LIDSFIIEKNTAKVFHAFAKVLGFLSSLNL